MLKRIATWLIFCRLKYSGEGICQVFLPISYTDGGLKAPVAAAYPKIAGQYQDYLYYALKSYTVNNANVGRNNAIMQSQMKPYSDKDLRDMAAYIASLPSDLVVKK
ncbi:MAG: cytochrome c [Burkholderiaceae bacterium]|nr:cytochrome c [Burkholderiaceae bacterium]